MSRIVLVTVITAMMFLVLVISSSPSFGLQPQQAQATAYGLGDPRLPPAYIIIDGKISKLQLENGDPLSAEGRTADYNKPAQGTISFGERFQLLTPQFSGFFKDVQSASLLVCGDTVCNDDFHIRQELVNTREPRVGYIQTHVIDAPGAIGDGFTASDVGFKIFLFWQVSFTDGTDQTYLAIVHLKGDPCEEHGWAYGRGGTTCFDPNE
jgi:hypothetical protein